VAVFLAAAVLTGTAAAGDAGAPVGPGPVARTVVLAGYRVELRIAPNAGGRRVNTFTVETTRSGRPVAAAVSIRFTMPAMRMPDLGLRLRESRAGVAVGSGEKLTMPGVWRLTVTVRPRGAQPFAFTLVDVVRL
jgi:hypothetical protein